MSKPNETDSTKLTCQQCDREYDAATRTPAPTDQNPNPLPSRFCCQVCENNHWDDDDWDADYYDGDDD